MNSVPSSFRMCVKNCSGQSANSICFIQSSLICASHCLVFDLRQVFTDNNKLQVTSYKTKWQVLLSFCFIFPFPLMLSPNTQSEHPLCWVLSLTNMWIQFYNCTIVLIEQHCTDCTVQEYSFSLYSEAGTDWPREGGEAAVGDRFFCESCALSPSTHQSSDTTSTKLTLSQQCSCWVCSRYCSNQI